MVTKISILLLLSLVSGQSTSSLFEFSNNLDFAKIRETTVWLVFLTILIVLLVIYFIERIYVYRRYLRSQKYIVHKMKREMINVIYPHVQISQIVSELDLIPDMEWVIEKDENKFPHEIMLEERKAQHVKKEWAQKMMEREKVVLAEMRQEESINGEEIDQIEDSAAESDNQNEQILFMRREEEALPPPPEEKRLPGELKVELPKEENPIPKFVPEPKEEAEETVEPTETKVKLKNDVFYEELEDNKKAKRELEMAVEAVHQGTEKQKEAIDQLKVDYEAKLEEEQRKKIKEIEEEKEKRRIQAQKAEEEKNKVEQEEFEYAYNAVVSREREKNEKEEEEDKARNEKNREIEQQLRRDAEIEEQAKERAKNRLIDSLYTQEGQAEMEKKFEEQAKESERKLKEEKEALEEAKLKDLEARIQEQKRKLEEEERWKNLTEEERKAELERKRQEEAKNNEELKKKQEEENKKKEEERRKREEKREERRKRLYERMDVPAFKEDHLTKAMENLGEINMVEIEYENRLVNDGRAIKSLR